MIFPYPISDRKSPQETNGKKITTNGWISDQFPQAKKSISSGTKAVPPATPRPILPYLIRSHF